MLHAQPQCTVTHYNEVSGMAQWYVTQIVQDKQGMMWFSTWNGLNRYDGYEFVCFKTKMGDGVKMPSDRIQDMMLTDDGNLLCEIEKQAFLFDVKTCKFKSLLADESKKALNTLAQRLWQKGSLSDSYTHQDSYGVKWSIHRDGRIYYSQNGRWTEYPSDIGQHRYLLYGTTDRQGNLWMRSDDAVYKLTFSQKKYGMLPQDKPMHVRSLYVDSSMRYWVTTRDDASIRLYDKDNRLLGYLGRDGKLHHDYTSFGSPIYHIMQDAKGTYWLSSKPSGLFHVKEHAPGMFAIEQFIHDPSDKASLSSNDLYGTAEDQWGRLWIATFDGGMNCLANQSKSPQVFSHKDNGLSYPADGAMRVRQIHITNKGILLAATTSGLLVADVSKQNISEVSFQLHVRDALRTNSLSSNAVMYVLEDSKHRIFVCTESGGVNQVLSDNLLAEELEFKHFNTASDNLPTDITLSGYEYDNCLVIVANGQLIKLYPDENRFVAFDRYFWKDVFRFSEAYPVQLPDGRRIFGLQKGALIIRDKDMCKSDDVIPIALTSITLHNDSRNLAVNNLDTLILHTRSERDLSINFAALDYSERGVINYAYQLDDDGSWIHLGKEHSTTFLNMQPGTYRLKIRSTNSDGLWVDNTRILTIIVKPTFWETPWAKMLYILLASLILWGILYTRRYIVRINTRQKELHEAYLALLNANPNQSKTEEATHQTEKSKMKPEDEAFMQRAMQFIEEHLGDSDISIGDMADATATSRSGLNRKMKSLLGVTPLDFIREARIRKACAMLKEGVLVKDVAYACGFSDVVYFRKCFKADMGMAPSEYRDENYGK